MTRQCGSCSACCRWPKIDEINKPARVVCVHLEKCGHGCKIYDTRPKQCADYQCSWLRGIGDAQDRPDTSKILIDRRNTQFGQGMLVAKMLHPNAVQTRKGQAAIKNAARETGACLVVDYDDSDRVIGVAGPKELQQEVKRKRDNGVIRVGGSKDWIANIISDAQKGKIYPGLTDGR